MTVPQQILREVYGGKDQNTLLRYLAKRGGIVRYNQAQRDLDLRREQFKRALESLERLGLVRLHAEPSGERPERDDRRIVHVGLSAIGDIVARMQDEMNASWLDLMHQNDVPTQIWRPDLVVQST